MLFAHAAPVPNIITSESHPYNNRRQMPWPYLPPDPDKPSPEKPASAAFTTVPSKKPGPEGLASSAQGVVEKPASAGSSPEKTGTPSPENKKPASSEFKQDVPKDKPSSEKPKMTESQEKPSTTICCNYGNGR